jgi:hypothetical protein
MPTTSESRSGGLGASRPDRMDPDASEVEAIDARPRRRLRKPSAKAQQSEENRLSFDVALGFRVRVRRARARRQLWRAVGE